MDRIVGFFTDHLCVQTDRFLLVILCLFAFIVLLGYTNMIASKQGKTLFWIGIGLIVIVIGVTVGGYSWRSPHGLSGSYYDNPSWADNRTELDRYFETNGRRVDRFIDFDPNDFNGRYPFSDNPFSIKWEGYIYAPDNNYTLEVKSNFGTWLYVDDKLVAENHKIDFGIPESRTWLRKGWYSDEWWGGDPALTFVWSSGRQSELYLGVDELTDYSLIFRCIPFVFKGSPEQEVTVYIAGRPVGAVVLKKGWGIYTIDVPHSVLRDVAPGVFRVKFAYSHVARPSEVLKPSNDSRRLAVAFDFAMMQKVSGGAGFTRSDIQANSLSQGIHCITLKAQSNGLDPFIRLTWKLQGDKSAKVIPEDYLFPENTSPVSIQQRFVPERIILGVSIGSKFFLSIFFGILVVCYIVTTFLKRFLKRDTLFILGIGLLAFGIRMAFLFERKHADPTFYILVHGTDQLNYVFSARGFFRGYWPSLAHAPFFQAPLISFYYIVCSMLFGEGLTTIRVITATIATGSIFLTFILAKQVFNRTVAYIAALFCACNGILIFYDTSVLIAPLVIFLNLVALWLIFKLKECLSLQITIALGIVLGLTALTRANIFLLMPFLLLWMLICFPDSLQRRLFHYVFLCVLIILTILPVTIRNYFSSYRRSFVLTNTNGGVTLWVGNNASSTGMFGYSRKLQAETGKRMKATGTSYVDEVVRYIQEHPREYLKLEYKKLKMFWRGYEIGNLLPYYFFRQHYSNILKFPWLNFVLIGPLGITGMFLAIKRWKPLFILYGFVCVQMLTTLLFFALARYRVPVVPVLSIFAAYAFYVLSISIWRRNFMPAALIFLVFAGLYVGINYPYAAEVYEQHYQKKMPLVNVVRYWDLFHFHVP